MKIRRLSIIFFVALTIIFFYGCSCSKEANNQNTTNEIQETYFSVSDISDDNTTSSEKEVLSTLSDDVTSNEQVNPGVSETVTPTDSESDYETTEASTRKPEEKFQGEPEVNFSDLM